MTPLTYISLLVVGLILLSVSIGFYLGRSLTRSEREKTLQALLTLLRSTEDLSQNMDTHNHELEDVGLSVRSLQLGPGRGDELSHAQQTLLGQIKEVIHANQKLEDDLVCAKYDLELQAQELDRTRREARTDALAGIPNRKAFDEALQFRLSRLKRKNKPFVLVLADIDHFKWINDTHGHPAGDRVVSHIGAFLQKKLRSADFVARFGGDEFAILLTDISEDVAMRRAEELRAGIDGQNFHAGINNDGLAVTFSMGLAAATSDDTGESLLEKADQALYRSKRGGRNQLNVYAGAESPQPVVA